MYLNKVFTELGTKMDVAVIDTNRFTGDIGITYELCAGIVDKDKPLEVILR